MKRAVIASLLTIACSSVAFGLARHSTWSGKVMGLGTSRIQGMASVKAGKDEGTTEVTLSFTGDEPSKTRPWHVHVGSCANATGVFGAPKMYPVLVGDANGAGKATVTIAAPMPESGEYSVNFHESPSTMATYVACGDLKFVK